MNRVLLFITFIAAIIFISPAKANAETINIFKADYNLLQSGHVEVTERIEYDFGFGAEERHGIYRFIPYKYILDNGDTAYINISQIKVVDQDNQSYEFEKYKENGNVVIKIGDPNRTITGVHTYVLSYVVKGSIKYSKSSDEFHWNVNGFIWDPPISFAQTSATVHLPESVDLEKIEITCYAGAYNSQTKCTQSAVAGRVATFNDQNLSTGENLTVAVKVPVGTFEKLDAGYMGSGLSTNFVTALFLFALGIPALTFMFMLRHWWKHGRDPKGRGTIIAEYSAPDGLTPIEVGTLLDNRVDNKDLSAEIIYLATRGYLKIRREEGKGIFKKDDYTLIKLPGGKGASPDFDNTLISGIFGTSEEVLMSSLNNEFYTHVATIKTQVHASLVDSGYFKGSIGLTIGKYVGIATAFGFVGYWIAAGIGALTNGVGTIIFAPAFILSAVIVAAFGLVMPARTAKGVSAKERTLGLKEYMRVAESDRIKFHNAPKKDPKVFEQLLPYAMVLGVEKEWAEQFKDIYKGNPGWYDDPAGHVFVPLVFVNNMHSFSTIATQNMTSSPSSSGSGFGGGGFSGGGFGGGGGGSW